MIRDEPTTGLDPNQLVEIRNLISGLGKHKTVMLSTHIMQEVEAICKRVIIISKGKIMANDLTGNIAGHVIGSPHTIVIEFSKDPDNNLFREITAIELTKTRHMAVSNQGRHGYQGRIIQDGREEWPGYFINAQEGSKTRGRFS
jgi:ABC-type multidrug transport system ATPase subunit